MERGQLSQDQQAEFMNAGASYAQTHQHSLVDPGAPLLLKKLMTRPCGAPSMHRVRRTATRPAPVHLMSSRDEH